MQTRNALDQIAYLRELITQTRLRTADSYPYFLLWGVLWIIGHMGSVWLSYRVWIAVGLVGGIASLVIGLTQKKGRPVPPLLRKIGWLMLVLLFYTAFLFRGFLLVTQNRQLINCFWPFHMGLFYLSAGVFMGRPIILIGGWLIFVAVTGILVPTPFQEFWLAVGGGSGLLLTGIILKKQVISDG